MLTTRGVLADRVDTARLGPREITIPGYKFSTRREVWSEIHTRGRTIYRIPRYLASSSGVKYSREWKYERFEPVEYTTKLYEYQQACVEGIKAHLRTNEGVCFELEAGLGKTYVAGAVIHKACLRTLYVVPTKFLMTQTAADLKQMMPDLNVATYSGDGKGRGDVVVMVINSLCDIQDSEYFDQFGLSIYDECQLYTTPRRIEAIERAATRFTIGISAEIPQSDVGKLLQYRLGYYMAAEDLPGFFKDDDAHYTTQLSIVKYSGMPEFTDTIRNEQTGLMQTAYMTAQLMCDVHRMQLVLNETRALYGMGRNIFIWTDSRLAVDIIRDLLQGMGIPAATPELDGQGAGVALLRGGVGEGEIQAARNSRIIVATYQYAYVGVSLPKFDAMVMASPRKAKIYQTLKRIYRMGGDASIPRIVVDIVDCSTGLAKQLSTRMTEYRRDIFNSTITVKRINWSDIAVGSTVTNAHREAVFAALEAKAAKSDIAQSREVYKKLIVLLKGLV